jgi:hypothetical protein
MKRIVLFAAAIWFCSIFSSNVEAQPPTRKQILDTRQTQDKASDKLPSQTYKGLEVTVTGVERRRIATIRVCPHGNFSADVTDEYGYGFAVVMVTIKLKREYADTQPKRFELYDVDNKKYTTLAKVFIDEPGKFSCEFPFVVPEGTKLKKFQFEEVSFDLEKLESANKSN